MNNNIRESQELHCIELLMLYIYIYMYISHILPSIMFILYIYTYKISEFNHLRQRDQVVAPGNLAGSPLRVTFPKWLAGLLLWSVPWREEGSPACLSPPSEGGRRSKPNWYSSSLANPSSQASRCDSSYCFRPAHPPHKPLPFQKPQIHWTGISGDGIKMSGLNTTFLQVILTHDQLK